MHDITLIATTSGVTVTSTEREVTFVQVGVQGPAGPSAHGDLSGLADDDHLQYHTDARGDARYAPLAHASDTGNPHATTAAQTGADAAGTAAAAVLAHAAGTGVHAIAATYGLQVALDGKASASHDHTGIYDPAGAAAAAQAASAPSAKGVTNGDSHDHSGGDGAQIDYSTLSNKPTLGTAAATDTTAYEATGSVSTHAALTTTHGISAFGATLVDDTSASVARTTLGLGGAAILNVGTTTGTVAAGDDSRIVASTAAETVTTIGALINGATAKATPVDADQIGLMDSAASNVLKKLSWAALKTTLQPIFAMLAGTAGGQTIKGGAAASETLTLQSTAHATKGKITALPITIDEANLRVGIGQTTPTAVMHIKAGTATASTGPIKMTSGPLLTVPEAGVMEYLSGKYYITNATPSRRAVAAEEYVQSFASNMVANGFCGLLDNTNFSQYTFDSTNAKVGCGSFKINVANGYKNNDEYIPIDQTNRYILSMWMRSGDIGGGNYNASNNQWVGVALYDIDFNLMSLWNSGKVVQGATDTTLANTLNPGDTTITLTDSTGWNNNSTVANNNFAWYGYINSKGYTYPDYTYTRNGSTNYSSNSSSGCWVSGGISGNVITLRVPWAGPTIPAGVAVRNSGGGSTGSYSYIIGTNINIPNSWTRLSGYIGGEQPGTSFSLNSFRPGCAYIRIFHYVNGHGSADNNVYLSGVSLSVVSSANMESQIGVGSTYKASLQSALPANGLAVEGRLGVGTLTPSAQIHGFGTTEQNRSSYDSTTYKATFVSSAGLVTETLAGTASGIKWLYSDATTNAIYALATFAKNSTGAGAAGLGLSITLAAKSSTTVDMPQVTLASSWVVATHATRTSRGTLNAVDYNGTREAVRWESDGTVARLGFFGATAVVKPTALTTQLTTLTYTAPGTPDYAIADVTQTTPFGFTTADEARTILSVIKNLQDRVGQLETKLQGLGLLT